MKNIILTFIVLAFCFWHYGASFLGTILILSFLIFFHELGHFLAAKYFKVRVLTFSIGFGKPIYVKHYKGTDYQISSIFLGGYVKMKGQDDSDPTLKNYDYDSYSVLHPFKKILILFAGPFFNLLLAFLIYISLGFIGVERLSPTIGALSEYADTKLKVNDKILEINGTKINNFYDIKPLVNDSSINVKVLRNNEILELDIKTYEGKTQNIFGEIITKPLLGIVPKNETFIEYHRDFSVFAWAFKESLDGAFLILEGLKKLILAEVSPKNIGGIISIADTTTMATTLGISKLLIITALLSINLGILNLLPIPVLDGGHIVFNLYELVFKREVNQKVFITLSYIGMFLLFSLMIFATFNDITRIIENQ
ncbi:M50 family metallopeptidase [Campylobacter sp. RM12637]|uniref:M50 family metallopeptidase n=1 Tax=Campylobacter sp. RM12637 TaxID=2735734 RepID=UPI0030145F94|nr:site-2 protease family protein [Campylobacter sp. RM12637]